MQRDARGECRGKTVTPDHLARWRSRRSSGGINCARIRSMRLGSDPPPPSECRTRPTSYLTRGVAFVAANEGSITLFDHKENRSRFSLFGPPERAKGVLTRDGRMSDFQTLRASCPSPLRRGNESAKFRFSLNCDARGSFVLRGRVIAGGVGW